MNSFLTEAKSREGFGSDSIFHFQRGGFFKVSMIVFKGARGRVKKLLHAVRYSHFSSIFLRKNLPN